MCLPHDHPFWVLRRHLPGLGGPKEEWLAWIWSKDWQAGDRSRVVLGEEFEV